MWALSSAFTTLEAANKAAEMGIRNFMAVLSRFVLSVLVLFVYNLRNHSSLLACR